ncbi:class I SAM-dependent methyltransferase [Marinobacterium weihaiense]|uniref:Class I SAM-dependent methyltransferase n=1 Tax=Marinobacterium weihaiense TaxID=2851016 RepID=A0ABS6MAY1_9GAMM|nr:class I SAM-dependent methyltransferase [Marinobacterium weihaiense]MBV0933330.1 class I SAM-dependent methyltransferase [Marinobacterium weihaiense]
MLTQTIAHYHLHAARYSDQYDSIAAASVHAGWAEWLAEHPAGRALDVGAGSGRDAAWLAQQGWQVTAIEPARALREHGQRMTGDTVHWIEAQLPALDGVLDQETPFDLILLSAVWMHLPAVQRPRAMRCLAEYLAPKGLMVITLRFGPSDPERPIYPVSTLELSQLAAQQGLVATLVDDADTADQLQRTDIHWQTVCIRHRSAAR